MNERELAAHILENGVFLELVPPVQMGKHKWQAYDRTGKLYASSLDKTAVITATLEKLQKELINGQKQHARQET